MPGKVIHSAGYIALIRHVKDRRLQLGLSQEKLGALVGRNRKWVQRVESCERRLDVVETLDLLRALKIRLSTAVRLVKDKP